MNGPDKMLKLVEDWRAACEPGDPKSNELKELLDNLVFLERVKFQPFVPTLYSKHPVSFMERFHDWLHNPEIDDARRRDLFDFANHIVFFSFDDFAALFRTAFTGPITRWCMDQAEIRLTTADWQQRIETERHEKTWFCPITDSLLISVFHHVNQIEGKKHKPTFRELAEFGDGEKVRDHIEKKGFTRLVLLEDFVGTGTQSMKGVKWALRNLSIPILFCPILIANEAVNRYKHLADRVINGSFQYNQCPNFSFKPIFTLGSECFIHEEGRTPIRLYERIRQLSEEVHSRLSESGQGFEGNKPLGFWKDDSPQKGTTVAMFSNTPNNSLPLIHHDSASWRPLFPRVARQPL